MTDTTVSPDAGNPFAPIANEREFKQILSRDGQSIRVRNLRNTNKCTDCWDGLSGQPDPDCPTCTGGGWDYTELRVKVVFAFDENTHGIYSADNVATMIGHNARRDAYIAFPKSYSRDIRIGDFVLHPSDTLKHQPQIEYEVIAKHTQYGSMGNVLFFYCILFKAPEPTTIAAYGEDALL